MNHLQRHLRVSEVHVPHLKVAFASSDMKDGEPAFWFV